MSSFHHGVSFSSFLCPEDTPNTFSGNFLVASPSTLKSQYVLPFFWITCWTWPFPSFPWTSLPSVQAHFSPWHNTYLTPLACVCSLHVQPPPVTTPFCLYSVSLYSVYSSCSFNWHPACGIYTQHHPFSLNFWLSPPIQNSRHTFTWNFFILHFTSYLHHGRTVGINLCFSWFSFPSTWCLARIIISIMSASSLPLPVIVPAFKIPTQTSSPLPSRLSCCLQTRLPPLFFLCLWPTVPQFPLAPT